MSPNVFGKLLLGSSEIQLGHKQQKMDCANRDDTAPPTPALNAQLLPSLNEILILLIDHNSQGKMVVWFKFPVKIFHMLSDVISAYHCCEFTTVFVFLPSNYVTNEIIEDLSRHHNEPISRQYIPYKERIWSS